MRGNMLQHSKKATDYAHPKLMAKELVSPKDFLENIYDTTPDGIMVSDNKGYIIRVNRALEKMLGFSQEETHWQTYRRNVSKR